MKKNGSIVLVFCSIILVTALFLAGCSPKPTKLIRITEYAAESPIVADATVGGCSVKASEEQIRDIELTYTGDKCQIIYISK